MGKLIGIFLLALALCHLSHSEQDWWENGNFYQIYPRSFKDSDGDGVGDLNGVNEKLEYVKDIGMKGVWLSPIFQSPMADFGYDISNYTNVQPEYGTNEDLLALIERAHSLGLHLILDFVPNHTSDEHEWFQRSVANDSYYRDFYIWHDGVINSTTGERQPPSNWISQFRYSAWEWNEQRQQYYLHQFGVKQPDLNYRNPNVLEEMNNILRFWLARGIDGFRIDAVPFLFEVEIDPQTGTYPDEPLSSDISTCPDPDDWCHLNHTFTNSLPEDFEIIYQWRELVDQWTREHNTDTKVLLTEAYTSFENLMHMYGDGLRNGSHVPFNFEMLAGLNNKSSALDFDYYVHHWLSNMPKGVYANWVLGNHDNPRLASRFGAQRADLMNIFLQTLPGIAVTYNGEEYGLENGYVSWEDTVDPQGCNADPTTYLQYSRDSERTPFLWDNTKNAGFSTADRTWLPIGQSYADNNVAAQLAAENSHLKIFKQLTQLRQSEAAFIDGSYVSVVVKNVLVYIRAAETGDKYIVVLNIGDENVSLNLGTLFDDLSAKLEVVVSSLHSDIPNGQIVNANSFEAKAYNGYVLRLAI
ncbi:PREDICTED: maltase A1-like [Rhagoletis zephyria]|uniref:maltase A1-like n=1 Tax=Rhagoletis zephyria TaxID=28612 RepID=UPI0008116803|nr:PREDICTED: maltase A1-like [Rhagoletis zephyria]